jgi:hypothetical protein
MEHKEPAKGLCLDCPLELMQINVYDKCNNVCGTKLTLYDPPQLLKFSKAKFIGKYLTYVIPKYICNNSNVTYRVILNHCSIGSDIIMKNIYTKEKIDIKLINSKNDCTYKLGILITDDLMDADCNLCIEVCKFDICIENIRHCYPAYKFNYFDCCCLINNVCCLCKYKKKHKKSCVQWHWTISEFC